MPGDEEGRDRLIREIASQLKRPVDLDPGLRQRVMSRLDKPVHAGRRLAWPVVALAAGLGILAFFMGRGSGQREQNQGIAFSLEAPEASRVSLVGDFNNWDPAATPLARVSSRGRWEARVPLTPGRYQFTYMVDGRQWVRDPRLPQATGDDFGQPTSVITVTSRGKT